MYLTTYIYMSRIYALLHVSPPPPPTCSAKVLAQVFYLANRPQPWPCYQNSNMTLVTLHRNSYNVKFKVGFVMEWQCKNKASVQRTAKEFVVDHKRVCDWCQCYSYSTLKGQTHRVLGKCRIYVDHTKQLSIQTSLHIFFHYTCIMEDLCRGCILNCFVWSYPFIVSLYFLVFHYPYILLRF